MIANPQFTQALSEGKEDNFLHHGDCAAFLKHLRATASAPLFDFVLTSPPYNVGKKYGKHDDRQKLEDYLAWQTGIIDDTIALTKDGGSICWQVGNYISNGEVLPLDFPLIPIFMERGMNLRNRIIWTYGHGLHCKNRFSGRHETILWFTKGDNYTFNEEEAAEFGDLWDIPNVKSNHIEKTSHPCQFPFALAQRLILALTKPGDRAFDPFMGAGTTAAAAWYYDRFFYGCEQSDRFIPDTEKRLIQALERTLKFRDHRKAILAPR